MFGLCVRGLGLCPFSELVCDMLPRPLFQEDLPKSTMTEEHLASHSVRALLAGHPTPMVFYLPECAAAKGL